MKNFSVFFIIAAIFFYGSHHAQSAELLSTVRITSSPSPLGSGARALGMGNAFIAVADDATAASWNPGGLMQLETPEMSVVGSLFLRTDDITSSSHPESAGSNTTLSYNVNYFSAAYPFNLFEKNMVVSINYQHLYSLDKKLNLDYRRAGDVAPGMTFDLTDIINSDTRGQIRALAPAYAIQVTEDLSFGFTMNIWKNMTGGRNGWKEKYNSISTGDFVGNPVILTVDSEEVYSDFRGINFNVGVLWSVTDIITFGAVFKSPFTAKMDHRVRFNTTTTYPLSGNSTSSDFEFKDTKKMHLPLSYGAGLAFRFFDELTLAIDAYRTEWGGYYNRSASGFESSPIDGRPRSESNIEAATQVHTGVEYLYILEKIIIPIRGGFYWEPEPTEGSPEDFFGLTFGTGISRNDFSLDFAYQYKWANDVGGASVGIPDSAVDVRQHKFYMSAIYYF